MLVLTPRMRNSRSERSMRWQRFGKIAPPSSDFHEQRIVVGSEDGAGIGGATIEPDAESCRGTIG